MRCECEMKHLCFTGWRSDSWDQRRGHPGHHTHSSDWTDPSRRQQSSPAAPTRPGLSPWSQWVIAENCMNAVAIAHTLDLGNSIFTIHIKKSFCMDMLDSRVLSFFILMHVLRASLLTFFSSHTLSLLLSWSSSGALYLPCFLCFLHQHGCLFLPIYLFLL